MMAPAWHGNDGNSTKWRQNAERFAPIRARTVVCGTSSPEGTPRPDAEDDNACRHLTAPDGTFFPRTMAPAWHAAMGSAGAVSP